jgi:L-ascorbate metabolism protein UlaG (beta-lactamase superfamily)
MQLNKMGHACVRLRKNGTTLVVDPGSFSAPEALDGADAVLLTHEHVDHFVPERLRSAAERNPALRVWTNASVAAQLAGIGQQVQTVASGDRFSVAGVFDVEVHGREHALIHPDIARVLNVGYLIDGAVFHPGDALTLPGRSVEVLLLPVSAPWCKLAEVIDYARAVKPRRALPIHDAILSDFGLALVDRLLGEQGPGIGAAYHRPTAGESINL